MSVKIYFSASFFTKAEKDWNEDIMRILRDISYECYYDFKFFFPQEEIGTETDKKVIFNICKKGIEDSDIILANMDGSSPDSGTCFECGYAYGLNKSIYIYRTDFRVGKETVNGLLTESSEFIDVRKCSTTRQIALKILETIHK